MNVVYPEAGPFSALVEAARAHPPRAAVILGSGMADLAQRLSVAHYTSFLEVPGLAVPTVTGHPGRLLLGDWAGQRTLVFAGRLHYYEGHSWRQVTAPVQTAWFLGARILLLTNAAGGIHNQLGPGRMMVVRDHLEWTRPAPWRDHGPSCRGADGSSPYSLRLRERLIKAGRSRGIDVHMGLYAAVTGPSYETPAEIRALQYCGADAVGMSTAREVRAAADLGMECAAISYITNRAAGRGPGTIAHDDVLRAAAAGQQALAELIEGFLERL